MNAPWSPLFVLAAEAVRLGFSSGEVIGMRAALATRGGRAAEAELWRMLGEKPIAVLETQAVVAGSLLSGEPHLAPTRALAVFQRRVEANRARLSAFV